MSECDRCAGPPSPLYAYWMNEMPTIPRPRQIANSRWVHEGEWPYRVLTSRQRADLTQMLSRLATVVEYTGDEAVVDISEWRGSPSASLCPCEIERELSRLAIDPVI
jgi:hypothetical protein